MYPNSMPASPRISVPRRPAQARVPGIQLAEIKQGLAREEFVYYYQPKISLLTGKVSGAEALMRWVKPDDEVIPPDDFLPLAIESGLIKHMTLAMLPRLMADLSIIQDILPGLVMSFNLTAWNLESDEMVKAIRAAIAKFQLDPSLLQAELTESSVINSSGKTRDHILELTGMGVGLAMDDFGTGFSSIEVLSQWPFSAVKIDQGLIRRMETSDKCTTLVRSSIQMAHQLGIKTVAEGVESRQVFDFLLKAGCTEAQGFWLGRPMAFPDFLTYLKRDERWSGIPSGLIHIAQIDHIHWRRSLIDYAIAKAFGKEGGNTIKGLEVEMDPRRCRFGQWFQDQGRHFAGLPAFDALEDPHHEVHRLGQELLRAVEQGQPSDQITLPHPAAHRSVRRGAGTPPGPGVRKPDDLWRGPHAPAPAWPDPRQPRALFPRLGEAPWYISNYFKIPARADPPSQGFLSTSSRV
jgi:EAL domain-containing protein (putative c-di-GMP-specific phosphodiesterase class I)